MNNELIVEHLGFAPIHFVDDVLNIVNQNLYKALTRFEHQVENELGIAETEKRMQHVETLFERAIDSKFDRFELYVLNNILTIPNHKQVILPHYADLDFNVSSNDENILDRELDELRVKRVSQRFIKERMERKMDLINERLKQVEKMEQQLQEMEQVAMERNAFPINQIGKMQQDLKQLESTMTTVAQRGGSLEWSEVPMIGQASKDSARLQEEIKEYLGERAKEDVSSWEITQEYRDMVQIGTAIF